VIYPILIGLILYGISLAVTALEFKPVENPSLPPEDPERYIWSGAEILILGWFAILNKQIGWYANPLHFCNLGLMAGRLWKFNIAMGIVTLAVALNTLLLFHQELPTSIAGHLMQLRSLHSGFYFWMASLSVPLLWNCWQYWMELSHSKTPLEDS